MIILSQIYKIKMFVCVSKEQAATYELSLAVDCVSFPIIFAVSGRAITETKKRQ